jgi:putative inorganic carbon (HCO3(-)) transporter
MQDRTLRNLISNSYILFLFILPFIFYTKTNEVFEFNKIIALYFFTVFVIYLWTLRMIIGKKIIFKGTLLTIPLFIFVLSNILSTLVSIDVITSIFGYYTRFNGGLVSVICYALIYFCFVSNFDYKKIKNLFILLIYSAVIISFWAILEHFGHSPSCILIKGNFSANCWKQDVVTRVFATLGQPNWLAAYLVSVIPLSIYFYVKKQKLFWLGVYILIFSALLYTKSRSATLAFIIIFIYLLFTQLKYYKIFIKLVIFTACFTVLIGTPWNKGLTEINNSYIAESNADENLVITPSSDIRKLVWKGAVGVWREHPLLGSGVETFGFSYFTKRPVEHNLTSEWNFSYNKAHNEYLNYLANNGIIGLISYLIVIGCSFLIIHKSTREYKNYIEASYISILITNFFGFSVVNISVLFILLPAFAIRNAFGKTENFRLKFNYKLVIATIIIILINYLILRYYLADIYFEKAQREMSNGEFLSAEFNYKKAVKLNPIEPTYKLDLAQNNAFIILETQDQNLINQTDYLLQRVIKQHANNLNVLKLTANVYSDLGNVEKNYYLKQITILEKVISLAPTDARSRFILSLAYIEAGNKNKAIETLSETIKLKPDYTKAINVLHAIIDE